MDINAAFPSEFLKASDLQGRPISVTINYVEMRTVGDDLKPICFFQGHQKGLVLNKTNANMIGMIYGPETDNWTGQPIEIFPTVTEYQGRQVDAIRVRIAPAAPQQRVAPNAAPQAQPMQQPAQPQPAQAETPLGAGPMDDEIPFAPEWR